MQLAQVVVQRGRMRTSASFMYLYRVKCACEWVCVCVWGKNIMCRPDEIQSTTTAQHSLEIQPSANEGQHNSFFLREY